VKIVGPLLLERTVLIQEAKEIGFRLETNIIKMVLQTKTKVEKMTGVILEINKHGDMFCSGKIRPNQRQMICQSQWKS